MDWYLWKQYRWIAFVYPHAESPSDSEKVDMEHINWWLVAPQHYDRDRTPWRSSKAKTWQHCEQQRCRSGSIRTVSSCTRRILWWKGNCWPDVTSSSQDGSRQIHNRRLRSVIYSQIPPASWWGWDQSKVHATQAWCKWSAYWKTTFQPATRFSYVWGWVPWRLDRGVHGESDSGKHLLTSILRREKLFHSQWDCGSPKERLRSFERQCLGNWLPQKEKPKENHLWLVISSLMEWWFSVIDSVQRIEGFQHCGSCRVRNSKQDLWRTRFPLVGTRRFSETQYDRKESEVSLLVLNTQVWNRFSKVSQGGPHDRPKNGDLILVESNWQGNE